MRENRDVIERRIAVVFVVDPHGRVLMQHRSPSAAVSPNQWTMPGGKIEDGEEPVEAARREVYEETGLTVTDLVPVWSGTRPSVKSSHGVVEVHAFGAVTGAEQDDVVLGEGQAMVFLSPEQARLRDLGVTAQLVLVPFLESETYRQLRDRARGLRVEPNSGANGSSRGEVGRNHRAGTAHGLVNGAFNGASGGARNGASNGAVRSRHSGTSADGTGTH